MSSTEERNQSISKSGSFPCRIEKVLPEIYVTIKKRSTKTGLFGGKVWIFDGKCEKKRWKIDIGNDA